MTVTFQIECDVRIPTIGKVKYQDRLEFDDDSNVFGRVLAFREHMKKIFPECEYELIKAKQLSGD